LSEYADFLLAADRINDAHSILVQAMNLAELRYRQNGSMAARRLSTVSLERIAEKLAYCAWKCESYDEAVIALEQGKCRMLRRSMLVQDVGLGTLRSSSAAQVTMLRDEIRKLEAEAHGGMGSIENVERLEKAWSELEALLESGEEPYDAPLRISELSDIPHGSLLVIPTLTPRESVVYLIRPGVEHVATEDVISLPNLTSFERHITGSDIAGLQECGRFSSFLIVEDNGWGTHDKSLPLISRSIPPGSSGQCRVRFQSGRLW
jgi:hypothetical protein